MVKSEKKTRDLVWLRLRGYRVAALKPEFGEHAIELERAIHDGIPAYPDSTRADFYDVELEGGWAYIHVYRDGSAVYLVAHSSRDRNQWWTPGASCQVRATYSAYEPG